MQAEAKDRFASLVGSESKSSDALPSDYKVYMFILYMLIVLIWYMVYTNALPSDYKVINNLLTPLNTILIYEYL